MRRRTVLIAIALMMTIVASCSAGSTAVAPHVDHSPKQSGEVGMAGDFHIEVVAKSAGEYRIYLSDATRKTISMREVKGNLIILDSKGMEGERLLLEPREDGAFMLARGGSTNVPEIQVRIELNIPGQSQRTTVDLKLSALAVAQVPTPVSRASPTQAPAATSAAAVKPAATPEGWRAQWSQTSSASGLTAGMTFDPYPPQMGNRTIFSLYLTDSAGQPVADATVELSVIGGMAGMVGEHDESFNLKLENKGRGLYEVQGVVGNSDLVFNGMSLGIQRSGKQSSFFISKDDLPPR